MTLFVLAFVLALIFSAFFTAAESALFSFGPQRINTLIEEGRTGSAALAELRARPGRVLVLLRLGDAISDLVAGAVGAYVAYAQWQLLGAVVALPIIAVVIVSLGELAPLSVAIHSGVSVALLVAPPLRLLTRLLSPLLVVIEKFAGVIPDRSFDLLAALTTSQVREMGVLEGAAPIQEHERQLIERAFRLDETKAWNIMTPRVDVFAWEDSLTLAQITPQLATLRYSRIPVYGENVDDVTGILYVRDAYQALVAGQRDVPLKALAREPLIVPGSVSVTRLLREFQTRRIHLAIIVDEYGGTDGLVTLEDVLEELVGEIVDEKDVALDLINRISRHEIIAEGEADLREINHFFNTSFPQLEHRSLNGYLLEEFGRVPETGETLERDGVSIEVLEASETQVLRARLRRASAVHEPVTAPGHATGSQHIVEHT